MFVFAEGGKPENPGREKTLKARERINNKLNSHMTPSPGIDPGSQWLEASANFSNIVKKTNFGLVLSSC
jgi:hypothetical protein